MGQAGDMAGHVEGDPTVRAAFLSALSSFRSLAAEESVAVAWDEPSALAGYSVGGLVGHTVSCTQVIER